MMLRKMNHQDLQFKMVKQTMKKAMNNMSHVKLKITGMMKTICLIKIQKGMLQNHLACINYYIKGMVRNSYKAPCCTASIINQPRDS